MKPAPSKLLLQIGEGGVHQKTGELTDSISEGLLKCRRGDLAADGILGNELAGYHQSDTVSQLFALTGYDAGGKW